MRIIKLGNRKVVFKKASSKNILAIGKISSWMIQSLKELGKENVCDEEIEIILKYLENEEFYRL